MAIKSSEWYCVNDQCRKRLGHVLGGEFKPDEEITGKNLQTRGPNLVVHCPKCNTPKVWYTADPITRALYQLIDAIATQSAKRMIRKVSEETLRRD